jgi:two-component system KDP operon response regulator KdpE
VGQSVLAAERTTGVPSRPRRAVAVAPSPCAADGLPRLLIAEDDPQLRGFLATELAAAGFAVVAAADGAEALRLYQTQGPFDALLLDEEMPHVTGREILRRLRSRRDFLPALLFSGSLALTDKEQAELRVGPVVRKPCGLVALVEALCHTLAHAPDAAGGRVPFLQTTS